MLKYLSISILVVITLFACTRQELNYEIMHAPFLQEDQTWADSMVFTMSIDEKIGQLLIYQPSQTDSLQRTELFQLAIQNRIGGIVLEGMSLSEYLLTIDSLQQISRIPLFNASRKSVSHHNQFSDLKDLPSAATISAINNEATQDLIRTYYLDQLNHLGFNISFAPEVNMNKVDGDTFDFDLLNTNPENLIEQSTKMLSDIQGKNMLSVSSNFNELHYFENDTIGRLDKILRPYSNLVKNGLSGIHVDPEIFQIDTLRLLPPHFLKRYLNEFAEFKGLLIADWQEETFQDIAYTGVDVFVIKDSFENRFNRIKTLVDDGFFTMTDLNDKVSKVLMAKTWMQLDTIRPRIDQSMAQDIMKNGFDDYNIRRMYEAGLMLLQNPKGMLPFKKTYKQPFQIVQIGEEDLGEFQKYFSKYAPFSNSNIRPDSNGIFIAPDFSKPKQSKFILTLEGINLSENRDSTFINAVNELGKNNEVVLLNFGSPFNLIHFDSTIAMVHNFEANKLTQSFSAQFLFGALKAEGKLPLALNERLPLGHGIDTTAITRMKYTVPEEVGIAAYKLVGIDAIARTVIREQATPGCQVLVAKDGKIIYSKSFGRHDFKKGKLVQSSDLYDLASVTKVASTTIGAMKLYDEGKLKISHPLKNYIDLPEDSKIKKLTIKQLLTHQSGLQSNMPIASFIMYKDTTGTGCSGAFCKEKTLSYVTKVADSFYMDFKYQDTIWNDVYHLTPRKRKRYRYSDVNFNLMMKVIENKKGKRLDTFMDDAFYKPMNLDRLTYNPLNRFKKREIVPTTKEERFRNQLVHGYVHDESAALLGGVGGNAGLFGNAESIAPLFQMLLNDGEYGGRNYLTPETIALFTKQQRGTKRGLGFDVKTNSGKSACSKKASAKTYGHTGFTGTCVWVDPDSGLIFIFLSNRIHPDIKNRKLFRKQTRSRMHTVVYDALNSYPEEEKKEEPKPMEVRASIEK